MKYMVVMDGCDGYGGQMYFVGIFATEDEAWNAIDECVEHIREVNNESKLTAYINHNMFAVIKVDENRIHYPSKKYPASIYSDLHTDTYIGGYEE